MATEETTPPEEQAPQQEPRPRSPGLERAVAVLTVAGALLMSLITTLLAAVKALLPRQFKRLDITDKVALVTGGGSGIGQLTTIGLAQRGAKVITWDVNVAGNAETVRKVKEAGFECLAFTVDLCDRHAIYQAAAQLVKQGLKVDILVNNAGVVTCGNILDCPDEMVEKTFNVNILSNFWTVKAFLPAMLESNTGHIVTIASMAGKLGINKLVDYCSSKHAAVGFNESLRVELEINGHTGVHTTVVCPFFINTGMFEGIKYNFIPIMEPQFVADEIVDGILMRSKEVVLPFYSNVFALLKLLLSIDTQSVMLKASGMANALDTFVGRSGAAKKRE